MVSSQKDFEKIPIEDTVTFIENTWKHHNNRSVTYRKFGHWLSLPGRNLQQNVVKIELN